jgi:hypothetical protein
MSSGFLTEEEVRTYLQATPADLEKLIRRGKLTAFRVGGEFVRYRKEEVVALRTGQKFRQPDQLERSLWDKARDFVNFYALYFLLPVLAILLVVYIVRL